MAALLILTVIFKLYHFWKRHDGQRRRRHDVLWGSGGAVCGHAPCPGCPSSVTTPGSQRAGESCGGPARIVYGIVSCWMYVIGMGAAIFTGESDIAQIMVKAGLGIAGLLIIVFPR